MVTSSISECLLLAHCRRNVVLQQVGSYLGYTGRGSDALWKAARDPKPTWRFRQGALDGRSFLARLPVRAWLE